MSTLAISAANLDTLENNLQILANNVGAVSQNINTVNGHINDVEGQVNTMKNDVKNLEEEIKSFMIEIKQGTIVSNARQSILMDQNEFDKKFAHRDDIRRKVNGLLQSVDINAIKKSTIENISEEAIVNNPNYWLAPALVALCSWYTNNKELANKALKDAMDKDDEKTSLLFCLVHLRANRIDTSMKWLNRYLSMQNPLKMENKIISVLDAISSGVFGSIAKHTCIEKINKWIKELNAIPNIREKQITYFENYFKEEIEEISDDEFPYIAKYIDEKNKIKDIIAISRANQKILVSIKNIMNENTNIYTSPLNKIDDLLHNLVFNYEKEELTLKREIQKNKHIIEENGNISKALKEFEKTSIPLNDNNDFYTHLSSIATIHQTSEIPNTRKLAISLSKNFILTSYNNLSYIDNINELPILNIRINDWQGLTKSGDNELELQKSLSSYLDNLFHDEVYSDHLFNYRMLIATVIGIIGMFLTIKRPIIVAIIFSIVLIYNIVEFLKAYSNRDNKIKQLNEIKTQHKNLLSNILAEVVDYYFIVKNSFADRKRFIDYINSLNYEDYIKNSKERSIIIDGDQL